MEVGRHRSAVATASSRLCPIWLDQGSFGGKKALPHALWVLWRVSEPQSAWVHPGTYLYGLQWAFLLSWSERAVHIRKVGGSSPLSPTFRAKDILASLKAATLLAAFPI